MAEPENRDFERESVRAIRDWAQGERRAMNEHPEVEQLIAYQEGRLGEPEAERVRVHLSLCASCADELLGLEHWDAAARTEPEQAIDPALLPSPASLAAHRQRFTARTASRPPTPVSGPTAPRRRWPTTFALAASGLVAALALGWWMGGRGPEGANDPFVFDLVPAGTAVRRAATPQEIRVPQGLDPLVARLNLGELTDHESFRAEIRDSRDRVVWARAGWVRQPAGSFAVLIPRRDLAPGVYELRLFGGTGNDETLLATYPFVLVHLPNE